MSLSIAFWSFGLGLMVIAKSEGEALFWLKGIHYFGAIFIPAFFLHFVLAFLNIDKIKKKVIIFSYSLAIILQVCNFTGLFATVSRKGPFNYYTEPGMFYIVFVIMFFVCVVYAHYLLFIFYKDSFGLRKKQIKYQFLSMLLGFGGGSTTFLLAFNIPIFPYGMYVVFLHVPIMSYAIVAHRLMGIEIVMQKATRIIFSFLVSIGVYFGLFYLGYNMIALNVWQATIFAILPCMVCFSFFIWRMQKVIFKKEESYQDALIRTAGEMVKIRDPLKLIGEVANSIYNIIEARQISIFLLDTQTNEYVLQIAKGRSPLQEIGFRLKKRVPIVSWFDETGDKFYKEGLISETEKNFLQLDIVKEWLNEERFLNSEEKVVMALKEIESQMGILRSSLIIPSRYEQRMLGFLCLGGREGVKYTKRDVEVLSGFADDVAMNIRNAFLIQDLRQKVHEKAKLNRDRYDAYQRLETIFKEIVSAFAMTVSKIDPDYTYEHVEKTSKYAQKLVDELQPKEITEKIISRDMFFAGILLHDIGKIFIPKNILNKPGSLTDEEWKIIKRHPVDGFELLKNIKGMEISAEIIRHHHERIDGKGYPDGLKGDQISMGAKIVCVVDSFEAMTADRPYRKAKLKEEAITQLIENSGTQFDPQVVNVFVELCEKGEI